MPVPNEFHIALADRGVGRERCSVVRILYDDVERVVPVKCARRGLRGWVFEEGKNVFPIDSLRGGVARDGGEGRQEIGAVGDLVAPFPAREFPGQIPDGRHPDAAFVKACLSAGERLVVGGGRLGVFDAAVVGGEDDECVHFQTGFREGFADLTHRIVEVFQHGGVGGIVVAEVTALGLALEMGHGFLRSLDGRVDGEGAVVEQEGLVRFPGAGADEIAGAQGEIVGEIFAARWRACVADAVFARHFREGRFPDIPVLGPFEIVGATEIRVGKLDETVGRRLPVRRAVSAEMPFPEEGGIVAFQNSWKRLQRGIEGGVRVAVDPCLRYADLVPVGVCVVGLAALGDGKALVEIGLRARGGGGDAHGRGDAPAQDRRAGGRAKLVRIGLGKRNPIRDELIDVRGFVKEIAVRRAGEVAGVCVDVGDAEVIGEDEDDVGRLGGAQRKSG